MWTILDIGAQPPLTLRLVSGSGPLYLSGQHALEVNEDDLDLLDDEADEADESPVKVMPKAQAKKRPSSTNDGPAKKAKLDETGDSKKKAGPKAGVLDVGDDDYDSEEDEDFDASMVMTTVTRKTI
ncbi:nucleolar protein, partial [Apostichopus japonicus]